LPAPGGAIISTRILVSSPHHLARRPAGRYQTDRKGGKDRAILLEIVGGLGVKFNPFAACRSC
jgi:hypothetical protein